MTEVGNRPGDGLSPGSLLFEGQFTITRPVRGGGLGRIYGAKDTFGRDFFLKVCSDRPLRLEEATGESAETPELRESPTRQPGVVLQEAHCLSGQDHPNIIAFHQAFEDGHETEAKLEGRTLPSLLELIHDAGRRPNPREVVSINCRLLAALKSIHDRGLLHGDISPQHILLDDAGEPLLIDFGTARQFAGDGPQEPSHLNLDVDVDGSSPQEACTSDLDC